MASQNLISILVSGAIEVTKDDNKFVVCTTVAHVGHEFVQLRQDKLCRFFAGNNALY
jgi:hypothetical protein